MVFGVKYFLFVVISLLLVNDSSLNVIRSVSENSSDRNVEPVKANDDQLVFAHIIFRHGARNINQQYPNDPHRDETHWPEGLGQLTKEGKRQTYKLGQYFRKKYREVLGDKYSPNNVYIQSTDVDRVLMSAQVSLAGLFVPNDEEQWDEDLIWQPIPVHTCPITSDYILSSKKDCPRYHSAFKKYYKKSDEVQDILKEYDHLFDYWSEMCGEKIKKIKHVYRLYKTLKIEKEQNKPLAEWAEKAIEPNGPMEYIALFHQKMAAATKKLARLKSGFLLKEMLTRFSDKIGSALQPDRSLWFYSAHEETIANMLTSLGLFELHFVPYASSLHFELYKNADNEHYIQIIYRKLGEEFVMDIPDCGKKCPLDQFKSYYDDIIPDDFDSECSDD